MSTNNIDNPILENSLEISVPELPVLEISVPELPVLEISVPDLPVLELPVPELPVLELPTLELPTLELPVPELPVPELPVLELPVPELPVLELPVPELPTLELPTLELPVPEISVPESPVPELPTLELPTLKLPTLKLPTLKLPTLKLPTLKLPVPKLPVPELSVIELPVPKLPVPELSVIELPVPKLPVPELSVIELPVPKLPVIELNVSDKSETVHKNKPKLIRLGSLDQDMKQRINVGIEILLELYRVITSSLLILFVPQICDDHVCSINENLVYENDTYNTGLFLNFMSLFSLVIMYAIELIRENRLIKYLDINPNLANDNDDVGHRLELLPNDKKNKLLSINNYYKLSSYCAITIYSLNVCVSAAAVNEYYAGSQTTSTFITYVLFIATKFINVNSIINTAKNIFYSAYMKSNIQYNDVDKEFIKDDINL